MSSPIAIPRRAVSPAASDRTCSPSFSPSGLYVPLHRRMPLDSLSHSEAASSRTPSPAAHGTSARVYTPTELFALQTPALSFLMQARIHAACPEVLFTNRGGIGAAFLMGQAKAVSNTSMHTSAAAAAAAVPTNIIHIPAAAPAPTLATWRSPAGPPAASPAQRTNPRHTRPTGRGPERRRAALQLADNWRVSGTERGRAAPVPALVAAF